MKSLTEVEWRHWLKGAIYFNFIVMYRPGTKNSKANSVSHHYDSVQKPPTPEPILQPSDHSSCTVGYYGGYSAGQTDRCFTPECPQPSSLCLQKNHPTYVRKPPNTCTHSPALEILVKRTMALVQNAFCASAPWSHISVDFTTDLPWYHLSLSTF